MLITKDSTGFFYQLVKEALDSKSASLVPEVEFYVVNLLSEFASPNEMDPGNALSLLLEQALAENDQYKRYHKFKHIGDSSLYMAGFFRESLLSRSISLGLYVNIGGSAYKQAAALANRQKRDVYWELSTNFPLLVDILTDVAGGTKE